MDLTRHRRLIVEGMVCALVAVFAAQPALADPKDNHGNGNGNANGQGQANPNPAAPAAAAPVLPAPAVAAQAEAPGANADAKPGNGNGNGNGNGAATPRGNSSGRGNSGNGNSNGAATPRGNSSGHGNSDGAPGHSTPSDSGRSAGSTSPGSAGTAGSGKSGSVPGKAAGSTSKPTTTAPPASAKPSATAATATSAGATAAPSAATPATPPPVTGTGTAGSDSGDASTARPPAAGDRGGDVSIDDGGATAAATLSGASERAILGDASAGIAADRLAGRKLERVTPAPPPKTHTGVNAVTHALSSAAAIIPRQMWIALAVLLALVLLLSANTIVAAARTRRLKRQRAKLLEDVGLLQEALLPSIPALMGGVPMTVAYRPAAGLAAGGDFYDVFALPGGRTGLLLGDISGHGRDALAKTSLVRFTVRAHLEAGMSPREAISIAGRALDGRLGDDFATVVAAIHDPAGGTLTYASAGHPPPLVLGPAARMPLTNSSAPPLGVGFPTGQRQSVLPMPEGTTVVLLSDGLLETRIDGDAIGAERLERWVSDLGPDATAEQLLDLVVERADAVRDDLAAVILHAAPGATAPAQGVEQLKLDVLDTNGPSLDGFLAAAGVAPLQRRVTGRRVSEQLASSGAAMVEVWVGEHPEVRVESLGATSSGAPRERVRTS